MQGKQIEDKDGSRCPFSERFLQVIWNERHLCHEMKTEEGSSLRVISPGIWNLSAGPDFTSSALLVDGGLVSGAVEIHRYASDWYRHGHDSDPNYRQVILHAVWVNDLPNPQGTRRTLVLSKYIQSDWEHLLWELEDACYPYSRQVASGGCSLRWALTDDERVRELLRAAGIARFTARASELMRLAAAHGAEQALYETIFETLGYKSNRTQFRRLAQRAPLEKLVALETDEARRAMLMGVAGLLPDMTVELVKPEWRDEVSRLWDAWWRLGLQSSERIEWQLSGLRPYNTPFRRLMAGIGILEKCGFTPGAWLCSIGRCASSPRELLRGLGSLNDSESPFRGYRDFGHTIRPAADLLGQSRLLDMIANVLLPYLYGLAELGGDSDSSLAELAKQIYLELPRLQENRLYKEAIQRFLIPPSREAELIKHACQQQGFLNIYKSFCLALDNNCDQCPLR